LSIKKPSSLNFQASCNNWLFVGMNMEILPNFRTLQIQKHFHQSSVGRIKRTKNLEN